MDTPVERGVYRLMPNHPVLCHVTDLWCYRPTPYALDADALCVINAREREQGIEYARMFPRELEYAWWECVCGFFARVERGEQYAGRHPMQLLMLVD
jgi:hypothetical protein